MKLVDRDYIVMKEIHRWKYCLSRHIRILAEFSSQRTTDRRLKLLRENDFIERKHILYGVPAVYILTTTSKKLIGVSTKPEKIKVEQIVHDIAVLDTVIYFMYKYNIELNKIQSEKELHQLDGFSNRCHRPDFVFQKDNSSYCVEVELTQKAKARFEKNILNNFSTYDYQTWVVPHSKVKTKQILEKQSIKYPNIEIIKLEEVTEYVNSI